MTTGLDQTPSIFIQFAGQGVKYLDELRRLYTSYAAIQPFIQEAIAEIKKQAAEYDDSQSQFFTHGLDVDRWLEDPNQAPDLDYLLSSPLSHPLIYLSQIASYISVILDGIDQDKLLGCTHSATGFSTGVVAAVLVSMGLPVDELCKLAIKTQAMFFWQGVRTQQSILNYNARPRILPELYDTDEGSPSCMANVTGMGRKKLDDLIEDFSAQGAVYPAYELLPGRWIVAGLPDALVEFNKFLKEKAPKSSWRYTASTIAAHCPYLSYALDTSPLDARRLGLEFKGDQMKIPVWSNDTGEDLRAFEDIIYEIMRAYFTYPGVWRLQVAPLFKSAGITHVLDFGPGTGVASLTESYTSSTDIQVIRCTLPLGRWKLFEEILPAVKNT